jgi:hypothetical protein
VWPGWHELGEAGQELALRGAGPVIWIRANASGQRGRGRRSGRDGDTEAPGRTLTSASLMGGVSANKPATSCDGCFAWGVLPGQSCRAVTHQQLFFTGMHRIGQPARASPTTIDRRHPKVGGRLDGSSGSRSTSVATTPDTTGASTPTCPTRR